MIDIEERTEAVRSLLATYILRDLGCAAVTPNREAWTEYDVAGPYRFGWMPPIEVIDDLLVFSFCPELIAETTAWLDDDELESYLAVIAAHLVAFSDDPTADHDEVFRRTQDGMTESAPELVALVSQVELRALDEGIVRSAS